MKRPSHSTVVAYVALVMAMSGTAVAATGGTFLLGRSNTAGGPTTLTNTGAGAALALKAHTSTTPALIVNTKALVPNLNANLVGGRTASDLRSLALVRLNANTTTFLSTTTSWTTISGMSGTLSIPAGVKHPTVITYSAECSVTGDPGDWIAIRIQVDGHTVSASRTTGTGGTGDANFSFCSPQAAGNSAEGAEWLSASTQGYALLAPGNHTVTVQALAENFASSSTVTGRLDDMIMTALALG